MIVKRKTRKAIRKSVNKVIKKHGPKIAAGVGGSIASALATLATTEAPSSKGKKSNLAAISRKIADTVAGEDGKSRKKQRARKDGDEKATKREKKRLRQMEQTGESM